LLVALQDIGDEALREDDPSASVAPVDDVVRDLEHGGKRDVQPAAPLQRAFEPGLHLQVGRGVEVVGDLVELEQ